MEESYTLDRYFDEISTEALLTPTEEINLAKQVRNGSEEALDHMTRANWRFVVSIVIRYQNQ